MLQAAANVKSGHPRHSTPQYGVVDAGQVAGSGMIPEHLLRSLGAVLRDLDRLRVGLPSVGHDKMIKGRTHCVVPTSI